MGYMVSESRDEASKSGSRLATLTEKQQALCTFIQDMPRLWTLAVTSVKSG